MQPETQNPKAAQTAARGFRPICRYRFSMAVHLTRIYTRTGDDGTTGLSDFSRVSKNDARLEAYADCDEANSAIGVALALVNPTTGSGPFCCRSRTTCSTPAPTCPPRWWRTPSTRRCGCSRATSTGWRAGATSSTRDCPSSTRSSCPAERAGRAAARRPDGDPARGAGGLAGVETHGESVNVLPAKYLNRSRICCSSCPGCQPGR